MRYCLGFRQRIKVRDLAKDIIRIKAIIRVKAKDIVRVKAKDID